MLLPFVMAFTEERDGDPPMPEVVPVDELTSRAIEDAAADIEGEPEDAEWPTPTT